MRAFLLALFVACIPMTANVTLAGPARAALQVAIPEAKFTNIALVDALDYIRDIAGVNIIVDWKALEGVSVAKDTQVNLDLRNVRAEKVLQLLLAQATSGDQLTYYIDGNVVNVTTRAVADSKMIVVVYDVEDLVSQSDNFDSNISQDFGGGAQVGGGGGGGGGIFSSGGSSSTTTNDTQEKEQKAQKLIKIIEKLIRPDVWADNGGAGQASIEYLNGNLIVSAPRSVQEAIGGPLD